MNDEKSLATIVIITVATPAGYSAGVNLPVIRLKNK
jgi:hypothetical protein